MRSALPLIACLLFALVAAPALGQDADAADAAPPATFAEGKQALKDGRGQAALDAWLPLAREGNVRAQYGIAWIYDTGAEGVAEDARQAYIWYRRAARQGHTDAQYAVGKMYEQGRGTRESRFKAREWYEVATRWTAQGHPDAEFALGEMYFRGIGVPRDFGQAAFWYRRAAFHDHGGAQFVLGAMYEQGWGVRQSEVEAYYWYAMAARHDDLTKRFGRDYNPIPALETVKARTTPEEGAEIRRLFESRDVGPNARLEPLGRVPPPSR